MYVYIYIYINIYIYIYIYTYIYIHIHSIMKYVDQGGKILSHRRINVDHGINVDQHSKPRNKSKYSILLRLHLFRVFEC
jgi:hypothetical protein